MVGRKGRLPSKMRQQQTACKNIEEGSLYLGPTTTTVVFFPPSPVHQVQLYIPFTQQQRRAKEQVI